MPIGKRKRASDKNAEPDEKKASIEELNLRVEDIQENQKSILEKLENQQKVLEKKFDSSEAEKKNLIEEMRGKQELILEKLGKLEKSEKEESEADNKPSFNSVIFPGSLLKNAHSTGTPSIGRSFVLKHTFKDVSEFEEAKPYSSDVENHFGASWGFCVFKTEPHLACLLNRKKSLESGNWAITTKCAFRVVGAGGKIVDEKKEFVFGNSDVYKAFDAYGPPKFIGWEDLKKNYVVGDKLDVEVHVEILEMSGVYKENLRCFDESMKDVSDVVLVVGKQKFYVSKLYLATHSSYFKTLFLGNFQESNQSEIELSGICKEDFQNYLEVLYGDPAIDDTTVDGILLVADMYDTSIVIGKCIDFLEEKSEKSTKKKMQMAIRYNLDQLKKTLISNMNTLADIKSVIPENPEDLDHSTSVELLNKSLSLR